MTQNDANFITQPVVFVFADDDLHGIIGRGHTDLEAIRDFYDQYYTNYDLLPDRHMLLAVVRDITTLLK